MPSRDSRVRVSRRWVRALVVTLMLVVGLSTAAVAVTQTAWFNTTGTWKAAPGACTGTEC